MSVFLVFFGALFPFFAFFLSRLLTLFHDAEEHQPSFRELKVDRHALAEFLSIANQIEFVVGEVFLLGGREQGCREGGGERQ